MMFTFIVQCLESLHECFLGQVEVVKNKEVHIWLDNDYSREKICSLTRDFCR